MFFIAKNIVNRFSVYYGAENLPLYRLSLISAASE